MPDETGGVCYRSGELVRSNHQMCNVVNKMIIQLLGDQTPEVTFTCDRETEECAFQCGPTTRKQPYNIAVLTCFSLG